MLVAAVPASLFPWAKRGGFHNDFLPLALLLGITAIFVFLDCVRALRAYPHAAAALRWVGYAAVSVFLLGKARQPWQGIDSHPLEPPASFRSQARAFDARLAELPGGVIAPRAPFLCARYGGTPRQLSDMSFMDLQWAHWPMPDVGKYVDAIGARWALVSGNEVHPTAAPIAQRYQLDSILADVPSTLFGDYVDLRYLLRKEESSPSARVVFDFEAPLQGWTFTGDAFRRSPTSSTPDWQQAIEGAVGHGVANSYPPDRKDGATGRMTSPPFVLDRPHLALRIGGGTGYGTRAELHVDGNTVAKASPIFAETELMIRVVWDVSSMQGRQAQLVLVDEDTGAWGHITCDDVVLY
jgi:hypothetical protein